jgi:hypothetical protein
MATHKDQTVSTTVTLEIPDEVIQSAQSVARGTQTRMETILTRWVTDGMVDQAVSGLLNRSAPTATEGQLSAGQQMEISELLYQRTGELASNEYFRLDELLRLFRQSLVRKAQAITEWLVTGGWNTAEVHVNQLTRLDSSMLYAAGYDPKTETLEVVFNSGGIYRYSAVPPEVYEELLRTDSKGRYMWMNVLNLYPYERLRLDRE